LLLTIVGLLEAILAQMRGRLTLADRYRTASIFFLAIAIIMAAYTGLKPLLAAVAIRINLAEDAGGPKAPEVVETTGYLEWGGQTNGSSGSSGGLCSVVAGAYCLRASSNNCML